MTEVVVQIKAEQNGEILRLSSALDAFTKWIIENGDESESSESPHIMMMADHAVGDCGRRLVFQDRSQAAQFLVFWRQQKHAAAHPA